MLCSKLLLLSDCRCCVFFLFHRCLVSAERCIGDFTALVVVKHNAHARSARLWQLGVYIKIFSVVSGFFKILCRLFDLLSCCRNHRSLSHTLIAPLSYAHCISFSLASIPTLGFCIVYSTFPAFFFSRFVSIFSFRSVCAHRCCCTAASLHFF